jgi:hypothetical protein
MAAEGGTATVSALLKQTLEDNIPVQRDGGEE